jgi:hypothetical protein
VVAPTWAQYILGLWKLIGVSHDDLSNSVSRSQSARFAPRKLEIAVERFEVNPTKLELVRFLNEHVHE